MTLEILSREFIICQIEKISLADFSRPFTFLSVTDEEISLVCPAEDAPENTLNREAGYRCIRVQGTLDFSLTGILDRLSGLMAEAKIPIFALSTWNTDYILIREGHIADAVSVFEGAGYAIHRLP